MESQLVPHSANRIKNTRILNAWEVDAKMEMGLCILCDKPFTGEHQRAHKNIGIVVMEKEEEELDENEDKALNLSISTETNTIAPKPVGTLKATPRVLDELPQAIKCAESPSFVGLVVKVVSCLADRCESFGELKESLNTALQKQNATPEEDPTDAAAVSTEEDLLSEIDHQILDEESITNPVLGLVVQLNDVILEIAKDLAPPSNHVSTTQFQPHSVPEKIVSSLPKGTIGSTRVVGQLIFLLCATLNPTETPPPEPPDEIVDPKSPMKSSLSVPSSNNHRIAMEESSLKTTPADVDTFPSKSLCTASIAHPLRSGRAGHGIAICVNSSGNLALFSILNSANRESVTTTKSPAATQHPNVYSFTMLLTVLQVFDQMPKCQVAAENDISNGCMINEEEDIAFELYKDMPRMDIEHGNVHSLNRFEIVLWQLQMLTPELYRVHFLSYLKDLSHDDYNSILDNPHDCFDHTVGSKGFDLVSKAGGNEIALLWLEMMQSHLGHPKLTLELLTEAIHVTQQQWVILLGGPLWGGINLKLQQLRASNQLAVAKLDSKHDQSALLSVSSKSFMKLNICSVDTCDELRMISYLIRNFSSKNSGMTIDDAFSTAWFRNLRNPNVYFTNLVLSICSNFSLDNILEALYSKDGSWNAFMSAYVLNGQDKTARCYFEAMQIFLGINPDHAIFPAVLLAYKHAGLIIEMQSSGGYIDEAEKAIKGRNFGVHSSIYWSLLSACAAHGNSRQGGMVASLLLERGHTNPTVYVLLSIICALTDQWKKASLGYRKIMLIFTYNPLARKLGTTLLYVTSHHLQKQSLLFLLVMQ